MGVAAILANLLDPAELKANATPRFFPAHAGADVFVGLLLHVEAQLTIEFLLNRGTAKERTKTDAEIAEHGYAPKRL